MKKKIQKDLCKECKFLENGSCEHRDTRIKKLDIIPFCSYFIIEQKKEKEYLKYVKQVEKEFWDDLEKEQKESWEDDFIKQFGYQDKKLGWVIKAEDPNEVFLWIEKLLMKERDKVGQEMYRIMAEKQQQERKKIIEEIEKQIPMCCYIDCEKVDKLLKLINKLKT